MSAEGSKLIEVMRDAFQKKFNHNVYIITLIMYIYHALINALSAHVIHINNTIFYTHVEHRSTKTIYIRYCVENTQT